MKMASKIKNRYNIRILLHLFNFGLETIKILKYPINSTMRL